MATEYELRGQLATCTRIFAMQGMIGVFGHVSVYQPELKRVFITPGMGSDKGSLRAEDTTDGECEDAEGCVGNLEEAQPPCCVGMRGNQPQV